MTPTMTVAVCPSPRVPSQDRSSWIGLEPVTSVPVSLGSSPMTTSIAAPKRKPVTTARERNRAIQPILRTRQQQEEQARREGDAGDEGRDVLLRERVPAASTALAATAARPELGPTEICRQLPKIA